MPNPQNLKHFKTGDPKPPTSGKKKGYKAVSTYMREILQKKPIAAILKNYDKLDIPFKDNAEALAYRLILIAHSKNLPAAIASIKHIQERQEGKMPDIIEGELDINLNALSLKQLKELERSL